MLHTMLRSFLITVLLVPILATAQKTEPVQQISPDLIPVTFHGETGRLDTFKAPKATVNERTKGEKIGYHPKNDWILNENVNPNALPNGWDPVHQKQYNTSGQPKALTQNWAGQGYTGVNPADPSLDVGPNHVVQMINGASGSRIQVFNKTGTSLMAPVYFDNFMSMPGGAGDPIVMYDERADRWVLTEFSQTGNNMHVAVSTTPDPTGTYYTYSFNAPSFPDYPKYSIWENSYIITTNETTSALYALDRNTMLTGGATTAQRFTMTNFGTIGFQAATPVSLNGTTIPPGNQPAYVMRMRDDAWAGAATDALELWEFDIDHVVPANTTLTQVQTIGISPHESELCGYVSFACIPQPGTGVTLDPLRELLMNRIHYRNFVTHESIVCCHVTDVNGTDWAGIRWYELRRTGGTTGTWAIYQEGTYAPDNDHRWMPTIGISATGNIGLAYNVSSNTTFPSIRYTGRKECDPLGTMTEPETTIMAGTASNASNRYGDYNQLGLDPSDGETFWCTAKYNASAQWSTQIAAFDVPGCSPQVSFGGSAFSVNEPDADQPNGCLDYYILNVPISIAADPSQPADVTVNVTGGTATNGVDYTVQNNTFTFDDPTLSGNVVIWVYDDDYVEGPETITLDYTLNANGGNATTGTINQTVTITINDDDLDPLSMLGPVVTVFQDDFEDGTLAPFTTNNPAGSPPNDEWQVGNVAAAASGAYAIPASNTGQFAWVNDDACDCTMDQVDLIFPSVDLTGYNSANLSFYTYFEDNTYQGNNEDADLLVSVGGGPFTTIGPLTPSVIDGSWITQSFDITAYTGNANVQFMVRYSDGTGWLYGCTVDDVLITAQGPIAVQTAVNTGSGMDANLGPNETVHFYDPGTNDVMMTIVNTSAHDYGCVTVEVDRDGTAPTALQFASVAVPDYLHGKTYTVVPTNPNPIGTYDVTVYYEEAEVAAWEGITGNSRNNAEIIKVAGPNRINDVTPGNYTSYTINNVAATLGAFYGDVTFTSSFTNGFSGFGVGIYNISSPAPTHTVVITNPSCAGGSDGSIVVTASGGTPPYQYSIDNGVTWQASNTFNGLSAGTYNVIVEDAAPQQSTMSVEVLTDPPAVTFTSSSTDENCGQSDGTITINGSGGTGALQYSIDNGVTFQASGNFTGLAAGTYNIVVEDANGCQATGTETISNIPGPSILSTTDVNPSCANALDGQITINYSGGTPPLQFSRNGGVTWQGSNVLTGLGNNTYNIVVQDANGCQATTTVTLVDPPAVTYTASSTNENCGQGDGTLSISGSGGTGALQYSIDNGVTFQVTGNFTGLSAGSYNVVVEDANGCQATGTESVGLTAGPSINSTTDVDPLCNGGSDGSITVNATGGTAPLQYSNNGGVTFQGSNNFSGLNAGTYNIVVEDANGCQATSTVTLTDPAAGSFTSTTTDETCGAFNGTITISASGGQPPYQYSIDNGVTFQASPNFTGLVAGLYNIVVEDANGCQVTGTATVNSVGGASITNVAVTDPSCNGDTDGSIVITASGGSPPLTYSIDGGVTFQASGTFTGLGAGTYVIVVSDNNSCVSGSSATLTDPPLITYTSTTVDPTCAGGSDGTITIIGSGGTGSLQYSVDGGVIFQASSVFNGLSAGTYNIVVEDANGCQTTGSETLTDPPAVSYTATSTNENCGAGDGTLTITGSGGTGALTYSIDGGVSFQGSGSFTNLTAGAYNVVVQDANGCQATGTENVNSTGGATLNNISSTDPTCNGANDGTITISASGGTPPLQYSIDGGVTYQASANFTGLGGGSYAILVQDGGGCTVGGNVTLTDPPAITYSATTTDESCGASDGTITITASGGTGSLQYSIDNGVTFQASGSFTGLTAGTYDVVVEDANGCQVTGTETVNSAGGATITSAVGTDPLCNGDANGTIDITASGGTPPLQYSVDGGVTFQGSNNFSGLPAGTYNIVVEDNNGCQTTATVTLTDPAVLSVGTSSVGASCGASDGSATAIPSGGTAPYTYLWDDPSAQTTATAVNLPAGTYNVTVTDANGCTASGSATIGNSNGPTASTSITNVLCNGDTDGSASVTVSGGTSPYTYLWDDPGSQTTSTASNLGAGTYTVTITDASGCTVTETVTVNEPAALAATLNSTNTTCGMVNGFAVADVTGGTPNYSYAWDDPSAQTSVGAVGLAAGIYNLIVTDGNGCTTTASVTIAPSDSLILTVDVVHESCEDYNDGSITTVITGGTSPYTYLWSTGATTPAIAELGAGNYTLSATDATGCEVHDLIAVFTENADCIIIPTAISPNDDGANDTWVIQGLDLYPEAEVEVYNRWGTLLYQSSNYQHDWGGTYEGNPLPAAVYYYVVKISEDEVYTGSITVLR